MDPQTNADDGTLVMFGASVKALDDSGRIGGYLVLFGDAENTDASSLRDYFTRDTDFGLDLTTRSRLLYNHGVDPKLGNRSLGVCELKMDDSGVWLDGQLNIRDAYERRIFEMVKANKQGFSSGTAAHLVRREKQANGANKILAWPLGLDASLTPTPAEPRTAAVALKTLILEADPEGGLKGRRTETLAAADAKFLRGMIPHHEAALVMAREEIAGGSDPWTLDLARAILDGQAAEITRMTQRLKDAGLTPAPASTADAPMAAMKGEHLGRHAAPAAALAAVDRLHDHCKAAMLGHLAGSHRPKPDRGDSIDACLAEYAGLAGSAMKALMEADETEGAPALADASAKALFAEAVKGLHDGLALDDHAASLLALASDFVTRAEKCVTIADSGGRPASGPRRTLLAELSGRLAAAAKAMAPRPPAAEVLAERREIERLKLTLGA